MKKTSLRWWPLLSKLHRWFGLGAALVLLMLAITGIVLNHTQDLKLDSRFVESSWLLNWYEIHAPSDYRSFKTAGHYLSQFEQQLYFDQTPILSNTKPLQGAVENSGLIVAALQDSLLLLNQTGEIIEQTQMPNLEKIGLGAGQIYLQQRGQILTSSDQFLSWQPSTQTSIQWTQTTALPEPLLAALTSQFRSTILPLERVLLDIHSGRFFGIFGVIIVDMSGLALLILTLSGCWIWLLRKIYT